MGARKRSIEIFKGSDFERKITVYHAASLKNEIRFYLNDTMYYVASYCGRGEISIELREEEEKQEKKEVYNPSFKEILKRIALLIITIILVDIFILIMAMLIDNILVYQLSINTIMLLIVMIKVISVESKGDPTLKSKHSAEHMMVNFLEINGRLPRSMKEVKTSSRFSPDCECREKIKGIAESFIASILTSIIIFVVGNIIFSIKDFTQIVYLMLLYCVIFFILFYLLQKVKFLMKPIERILTNIVQCANTTRKVKKKDLILAYCVARAWIQTVYPEYYSQEEDTFLNDYT